jgi:hypothetical protein
MMSNRMSGLPGLRLDLPMKYARDGETTSRAGGKSEGGFCDLPSRSYHRGRGLAWVKLKGQLVRLA